MNNPEISIFKALMLIITFLLGLFSSMIVDRIRERYKNRKIKKFILTYLKDNTLIISETLIVDYEKIKKNISSGNRIYENVHVFEGFNIRIFQTIQPVDYYSTFKNNYIILEEIISIIEFLSTNLPSTIFYKYHESINKHLKENNKVGNAEHVKECQYCIDEKEYTISALNNRIAEAKVLNEKIKELIKNCG